MLIKFPIMDLIILIMMIQMVTLLYIAWQVTKPLKKGKKE